MAYKYFGNKSGLGNTVRFDTVELTVTGIIKDLPSNTHFNFDFIYAYRQGIESANNLFTYLLLQPGTDVHSIESSILTALQTSDSFRKLEAVKAEPLREIHFATGTTFEMKPPVSILYIKAYAIFGTLILLISISSHINLSVAMYSRRQKEIALRKVLGSSNPSLAAQFLVESGLYAMLCFPLSIVILSLVLPSFNNLMRHPC